MTNNPLLLRLFPFLAWFPISTVLLRGDVIAGITGALVLVPKAMAYAQLSGLPVYFGLYVALGAGLGAVVAAGVITTARAMIQMRLSGTGLPVFAGLALLVLLSAAAATLAPALRALRVEPREALQGD